MHSKPKISSRKEGGFVLIASMLMLIVMTLLAVSMYHNFTVQENVASNTKEKGRAFQLAQATLQYAEYSLYENGASLPATTSCAAGQLTTNGLAICSNPYSITNPTSTSNMTLSSYSTYSSMEPTITISTTGGVNTYYKNPQYYYQYLGEAAGGIGQIYQVTALSYGSTPNSVSVVQSVYQLTSGTTCLSCGP